MAHQTSSEDYIKDPDAKLDYSIDWYKWLNPLGDTILTSEWEASSGITIVSHSNTLTNTTVWLEGGTPGPHRITNRITTAAGRIDDRSITVRVQQR